MQHIINTETGQALDVEITGTGEPLLLIQGMSGHGGMWGDAFLEPLAREYEVISYDHRGVGASSRADVPFTIADLADDAAALLAVLGRDPAHVLGISMGGMVAQELALRAPERVRSLVLGCTTAGGPDAFTAPGPGRLLKAIAMRGPAAGNPGRVRGQCVAGVRRAPGRVGPVQGCVDVQACPCRSDCSPECGRDGS